MTKKPKLYILITAYRCENYVEDCLNSIVNSMSYAKKINYEILFGIDSCKSTLNKICKIRNKYNNISYYYSKSNCGTYLLKNSLLSKIDDKNSIIFFFDCDDIITPDFISQYYEYIRKLLHKYEENIFQPLILRTISVGVPCIFLNRIDFTDQYYNIIHNFKNAIKAHKLYEIINNTIKISLIKHNDNFYPRTLYPMIKLYSITNNFNFNDSQYKIRSPHGCFFSTYNALDKLGYFNNFRVAQDSDLLERAKFLNIPIIINKKLPLFIRRISSESLTKSKKFGFGSDYRKSVIAQNKQLLNCGKFVAAKESANLVKLF